MSRNSGRPGEQSTRLRPLEMSHHVEVTLCVPPSLLCELRAHVPTECAESPTSSDRISCSADAHEVEHARIRALLQRIDGLRVPPRPGLKGPLASVQPLTVDFQ